MVRFVYVCPVGTSLLQNFVRDLRFRGVVERFRGFRVEEWFRLSPDDPLNVVPDGYVCSVVRGHELFSALLDFLRSSSREACAEVNGIYGIRDLFGHSPRDVEVLLYHTRTCNSRLCSMVLEDFLRGEGYLVESVEVRALRSVDDFELGLVEVLDKVVRFVVRRRSEGVKVYVNATPGFKAEVTFLVIASILAGANAVVYIHDSFRSPVLLPIPPLSLNTKLVNDVLELFKYSQCLGTYYVRERLGDELLTNMVDSGVLKVVEDKVCVREWVKHLPL
jgi:putative CRISPR-associated protein (TIGR02619 family)